MADRFQGLYMGSIFKNKENPPCCPLIFTENSESITFSGLGTLGNPITAVTSGSSASTTADNGLQINPANNVQLGQLTGDVTNPAKLLDDTEIPFDGSMLFFIDVLNTDLVQSKVAIFDVDGLTSDKFPLTIFANGNGQMTVGSNAAYFLSLTPVNYNTFYPTGHAPGSIIRMDKWTLGYAIQENNEGGIGMPDTVLNFGYNTRDNGARRNVQDASWRFGFETNYFIGGSELYFEFHMPEVSSFDGSLVRVNSYYVSKTTGNALWQSVVYDHQYMSIAGQLLIDVNPLDLSLRFVNSLGLAALDGVITFENVLSGRSSKIQGNDGGFSIRNNNLIAPNGGTPVAFMDYTGTFFFNLGANTLSDVANGGVVIGSNAIAIAIDPSAQLQVDSKSKGVLFPRMTTVQKLAIATPLNGLVVYDTTLAKLCIFTTVWETITSV